MGALFRRGEVLRALAEARPVACDHTGTLTERRPEPVTLCP